jgi:hypothetical protein
MHPFGIRRPAHWAAAIAASAALVVSLAACGSSPGHPSGAATASSTSTTMPKATTTPSTGVPAKIGFGSGSVGPADPTTTLPNERGRAIAPDFGAGQNIIISPTGFEPATLEASVAAPVVWTNLSGKPQRIVFTNFSVDSGTIPPGGTFTWSTPDAVSTTYVGIPSGWHGTLDMNPNTP